MIELRGVHVTFNPGLPTQRLALPNLDLEIPAGQFITVIGSNGAGKSTLLNVLAGDVQPQRGRVIMGGTDVTSWSCAKRASIVARVFQDPLAGTCGDLTIEENLSVAHGRGASKGLARASNGALQSEFKDRLARLGLGLETRLRDKMSLLSGGQRQVVTLVMAALVPMKLLLLDEHTAALDPRTASFVLKMTDDIVREEGLTALMVTHSMRQALDHGSRLLMMHEGQIVLDVAEDAKRKLDVAQLLQMFEAVRGDKVTDDALLLG